MVGRANRPPKAAMRAACVAEEKERVWRNPYTFFSRAWRHTALRRCQIWIHTIPQMEGPHFIFDFSTNPYLSPNFIFSTKPNPNKKSDFRRSYIQSFQLGSSSSIGIISHSSSVIGGRFRTSSSYSFCGIYKTSKFTTNSLV